MAEEPSALASPGTVDPDVSEEELGLEIDNVIPSRGYQLTRVTALGGSAGGIPALQAFLRAMPPDPGIAFVVVLHLAPDVESSLAEILQRSTDMPVLPVAGGERVVPNRVYVIPPGRQLSMADGHLRLTELSREQGRRVTVDLLFRSLADTHGPHSTAIVLSGGDGDGAVGIKRVKERGGLTVAQDPDEAEHPGMPRAAIATGMVDWVLEAAEMPSRLLSYQAREGRVQLPPEEGPNPAAMPRPPVPSDESALRDVLTFLRTRTGRDFSYYKRATIVRRVARRMQVNEVDDLPAYLNYLRTHPGEAGALLQDLLISVTNFFRDREAFAALAEQIPALFRNKGPNDSVRVWVPACATGEEAYSIAIMLAEHARTLDSPPALQVFATDLDEDVILRGRNGLYPEAIAADVSADRLRRFFIKEHQGYRVRRELREMLLFAVHDLLKDSPFSRLDLISCRNLLIYLNREAQQRVFDIFHFALTPHGRLFLGSSETVEDGSSQFEPLDKKHRLYSPRPITRTAIPVPWGPSTLARALAVQERGESGHVAGTKNFPTSFANPTTTPPRGEVTEPRLSWAELHLRLVERLAPPSLIVNGNHDILHLSESASRFLQFSGGEPSTNLIRAVHPLLRADLRAALFRAQQSGDAAWALKVPADLGGSRSSVDIRVSTLPELGSDIMLVVFDAHDAPELEPRADRAQDEPVVRHLERELEQTKIHLRDLVEQHEASTEELKASNEELQAMNEELRSATEELETSREELQSINEELTTVNAELKAKIDELALTNGDLQNLMSATAIAIVFLDRELRIMRFTPPAVELFSLIPTDVGRPLGDLQRRLEYPELLDDAARVLQQLVQVERQVRVDDGRYYLARLLPYRTTEDRIAGVVLTFVDVTERQVAQEAAARAAERLEENVRERTGELDEANAALRREIIEHSRVERARVDLQVKLVNAQEEERKRISHELHDEVGQQISAIMLSLKSLEAVVTGEPAASQLRELRATAEHAGREIHQLVSELRPPSLDDLGLSRALSGYLEGWSHRAGISVDFLSTGLEETRLVPVLEITLYRIVQEALNNVLKHAQARSVSVTVERRADIVTIIIEDDGVGFDVDAKLLASEPRIGLAAMRERAMILGGTMTVESMPGSGTTVRVKLPLSRPSSPEPM